LANGWGNGTYAFSDEELQKMGLDAPSIRASYDVISERIGISSARGAYDKYTVGSIKKTLPPVKTDSAAARIHERFFKCRSQFENNHFFVERTPLAVLSQDYAGRAGYTYHDMDFWTNEDDAIYKPEITLKSLLKTNQFTYEKNALVLSFEEKENKVVVRVIDTQSKEPKEFACRKLFLAAGAVNTGRIALRSLGRSGEKMPVLCNPYLYLPCLNWSGVNSIPEKRKTSLSQLSLFYDENGENTMIPVGSLYTYRSLLLLKLIKEMPVNFREARRWAQLIQSALVVVGLFYPTHDGGDKFLTLEKDDTSFTKDRLRASFVLSVREKEYVQRIKKVYVGFLRSLGLFPFKTVDPGFGGSIHYGGTLPIDGVNEKFSSTKDGRLNRHKNVYLVDGSGFRFLPGKGLTLTLMANAHRVVQNAFN
jgi:hypothetical protein